MPVEYLKDYISLCNELNKPVTWEGLNAYKQLRKAIREYLMCKLYEL